MLCNTTPKGWGSTHIGETQIIKKSFAERFFRYGRWPSSISKFVVFFFGELTLKLFTITQHNILVNNYLQTKLSVQWENMRIRVC